MLKVIKIMNYLTKLYKRQNNLYKQEDNNLRESVLITSKSHLLS